MRRAKGHESRHIEGAHADDVEIVVIGGETQLPRASGSTKARSGSMPARANSGAASLLRMRPLQRQNELFADLARHDSLLQ
jgi:hypothetical protein